MAQYFSPGVYIQEVETGPVPIQGVATSITGAVGVTLKGPTSGKPVLVTSFNDFQNTFGSFLSPPAASQLNQWLDPVEGGAWWQFPLSVKGYFDNGGQQLYVKRVISGQAQAASGSLGQGLVADLTASSSTTATSIQLAHLFSVETIDPSTSAASTLSIVVNGTPIGTATTPTSFTVAWYDLNSKTVGLSAAPGQALKAGRDVAIIKPVKLPTSSSNVGLKFSALAKGIWGNSISVRVTPVVGATLSILPDTIHGGPAFSGSVASAQGPFAIKIKIPAASTLSDGETALINNQSYTISGSSVAAPTANSSTTTATFNVTALISDGLQSLVIGAPVVIVPTGANPTNVSATLVSVTSPSTVTVTLNSALPTGTPSITHVAIQGRIYPITIGAANAAGNSVFTIAPAQLSYAAWPANVAISSVRLSKVTSVNLSNDTIDVANASQLYPNALVELDNGTSVEFATVMAVNDVSVTFDRSLKLATGTNTYYEGQKIRVLEAAVNVVQRNLDGTVAAQESFSNLRLSYEADTSYLVNCINQNSKLVTVTPNPAGLWTDPTKQIFDDPSMFPTAPNGGWLNLSGGADNLEQLSVDDFVGFDGGSGNRTGIQALQDINNISICVVPGIWSQTVQSALVTFCESLADRFAILDPPDQQTIAQIQAFRAPFDSEYAALYHPWLSVRDPSLKQDVHVAPSAHLAGIYAQTDLNRGVFKAPANVVVAGINKFSQDIAQREQDVLNPIGINALRYFPNRGYRVWGARTLSSDSTWKYINVKRIFIFVEQSILTGTQWVVFEPNDEGTWSRVRQSVSDFLNTFWRSGGLQGATAKDAYFVACGLGVTMTQDDIDNGRLIVQVGIAPVKPAEFVIFQIQQYTQNTTSSS